MQTGFIGQAKGPFEANKNVIPVGQYMIIGVSIPEKELMIYENQGFYFLINNKKIKIGKKGMYEMDTPMYVTSFTFPYGAPSGTLVEYRTYTE